MQKGFDPNEQNSDGETALITAIRQQNKEIVKLLLNFGARVNPKTNQGLSPLQSAINPLREIRPEMTPHQLEIIKLLLDAGADPNLKDGSGYTPLMNAADNGHKEIFDLLLKYGAKIELSSNEKVSLLELAAWGGSIEIIEFLRQQGFDLKFKFQYPDKSYNSLLPYAALNSLDLVKYLLDQGVKFDPYPNDLISALFVAIDNHQPQTVDFFCSSFQFLC